MKLLATTSASGIRMMRLITAVGLALVLVAASITTFIVANPAFADDQYSQKIRNLEADRARFQAEADRLFNQSASLQNAIAQIASEKAALQAQIDLTQAKAEQLALRIADTEKQIKDNQDGLGETIADLYVDDGISPIEMLASSQNISDFLNKQEYRNSVRDQLGATIKRVKELKAQLDQQKKEVEVVLRQQNDAKTNLVAKESEQQQLLAQTKSDEANYQKMLKDNASQIAEARAVQALIQARLNNTGGYTIVDAGNLSAYPWNASNCPMSGYLSLGGQDGSGGDGYGYGCRQCASYAAWKIAKETGVYYKWGNGKDFDDRAVANGYQRLSSPQPGSIAVMEPATAGQPYGHVAWVEAVDGNKVTVSQYNYNWGQGYGLYSVMTVSANAFDSYVKIK